MYGLEPTYKELKRRVTVIKTQTCNRLEPTYKELKHAVSRDASLGCPRLEPTYKELKLINIFYFTFDFSPIRAYL